MTTKHDSESEINSKRIFQEGSAGLEAPPFLASRVTNEFLSRQALKSKMQWWKILAFSGVSVSFALAFLLVLNLNKSSIFEAQMGQATLVEVSLRQVEAGELARVEVRLPDGVTFVSEKYPEINGQNAVSVPVVAGQTLDSFPFIVRASESGTKNIKVRVFDKNGNIAEEKVLKIRFQKS
jgi:hypothetical protein